MKNISKILIAGILVIIIGFGIVILLKPTTSSENIEKFFKNITISIDGQPLLNQPVEITVIAESSPADIPNATFEIRLPEGFELISGSLKWQGNLKKNDTITLRAKIKTIRTGDYAIQFLSTYMKDSLPLALDTKFIYISVSESETKISYTPLPWVDYKITNYPDSLKTDTESGG